jgi:hypothetical protein
MTSRTDEDKKRKKIIFDGMSPRRQKHILKKGYDEWDPFIEPKDPIDIRQDKTKRTSQDLITEFFHSVTAETYSNDYGRGAFELCMGIINGDERYKGMCDFACWYQALLKREGHEG